jgi:pyruvate/2-oxoglutarate/acetoin dehydrogenase E1 component
MRLATGIAKRALAGVTRENASETQRAAAEMLSAHVIDLASRDDLDPKTVLLLSASIENLGKLVMQSDQYIREQLKAKVTEASSEIKQKLDAAGVARVVQKQIDEVLLGIVKA